MNPTKGHYSIVQYCPDLARRETVNIGVVLLVPERAFLQTRMVADNDAKLLGEFKKSFSARIEAEHGRISTRESSSRLRPCRRVATQDMIALVSTWGSVRFANSTPGY